MKPGDRVKKNDSLITLESEKASMEVPAEADGVVADVRVKVGDRVSEGMPILTIAAQSQSSAAQVIHPQRRPPNRRPPSPSHRHRRPPRPRKAAATASCMRAPRFAGLRANSASICASCAAAVRTDGSHAKTFRDSSRKRSRKAARRLPRSPDCPPGRSSTSPNTVRSNESRSLASRSFRVRTCIATGLGFPTSPTTTKPTSPRSRRLRSEVNAEQTKSGGPKLTMLAFLIKASVAALAALP